MGEYVGKEQINWKILTQQYTVIILIIQFDALAVRACAGPSLKITHE